MKIMNRKLIFLGAVILLSSSLSMAKNYEQETDIFRGGYSS